MCDGVRVEDRLRVRELQPADVLERAVVLCDGTRVEKKHLPSALVPAAEADRLPPVPGSTIAELEKYAILKTLESCGGSTSRAAMILGISTRKIQYKIHEYGEAGGGESRETS